MKTILEELRALERTTVTYLDFGKYRLRLSRAPTQENWWIIIVLKPDDKMLFSMGAGSPEEVEKQYRDKIAQLINAARELLIKTNRTLLDFEKLNPYDISPKSALERVVDSPV